MRPFRWLVLVWLAAALTGCPSKPAMQLHGARISTASPMGVTMMMTMRVENRNSFDIRIRNVRASVVIANRFQLPPIVHSPNEWLPAGGTTFVPVPVTIPWHMMPSLLGMTAGSRVIGYEVRGYADVTAVRAIGIDADDFHVDEQGRISRMELLAAAGRGMR